ncbi:thermostable hemolysin [Pseudomarimonas arenosa]|uniref:Thermostable hemolysin n=1 Tax=Pseudomarimonas arenosa TaxID=2774145 RepID=A0AAW3ZQN0_9GAMM|nr:thermostable hemolysin [Pseudomarimonas arenosa]MBD8526601.1 thermostable hemolysin [Pseudomarimonas arenosa]
MPTIEPAIGSRFSHARLLDAQHPERGKAEAFVAEVYQARFSARITEFMPHLLCFYQHEQLAAVVGLRCAARETLFCETYLGGAAESVIAEQVRAPVSRRQIVEMGNFAANDAGTGRRLILSLIPLLNEAGSRFVMFVATRQLRNAFARLGLQPISLGAADAQRLGAAAGQWGRYYDEQPQVMVGDLTRAPSWATAPSALDACAKAASTIRSNNPLLQSRLCVESR